MNLTPFRSKAGVRVHVLGKSALPPALAAALAYSPGANEPDSVPVNLPDTVSAVTATEFYQVPAGFTSTYFHEPGTGSKSKSTVASAIHPWSLPKPPPSTALRSN